MAKIFSRPNTSSVPGSFSNPSGLKYATRIGHSAKGSDHREMPPYILPSVWDYRKPDKNWRPFTPSPTKVSSPAVDFTLYHPDGMVPYYTGYIPYHKFKIGITYGRSTKEYGLLHYSRTAR